MMNHNFILKYADAKPLIREADVLLFRGNSIWSKIIRKFTQSPYSHAGLASWHNGSNLLELIEFKEWKGGRCVNLQRVVEEYRGQIDVYRPATFKQKWEFYPLNNYVAKRWIPLEPRKITNTMRKLTGLPYGWKRIWWFTKQKLIGLRLFYKESDIINDTVGKIVEPVCSTAVAHSFSTHNFDLVHNRADNWMEPNHIGMSPLLSYVFTLTR